MQVLAGAAVALVVAEKIALAALIGLVAAGDDVQRQPAAAGQVVEADRLPRGQRRCDEARAVGQQDLESLGGAHGVVGHLPAVGPAAAVADQDAIEPAVLVRARKARGEVGVDRRTLQREDLGGLLGGDHADEFDGHWWWDLRPGWSY